jgi:predicted DNA-binding antitoxin AbrB/MazE fold protein
MHVSGAFFRCVRHKKAQMTIHAIYENGVFRPTDAVNLPERSEVILQAELLRNGADNIERSVPADIDDEGMKRIYEILSERYSSGEIDVAARHNEHQP